MDLGDTPAENTNFLFFCAAVIQAVNRHQGLLRASVANIGQDYRWAPTRRHRRSSRSSSAPSWRRSSKRSRRARRPAHPGSFLELASVLPLPMHGGDRNRTSPFAFTGNKFEFRALGSSMSLSFPNTVLNTIVAEAIDELADKLEAKGTGDIPAAVAEIVGESYSANKQIRLGRQLRRGLAR